MMLSSGIGRSPEILEAVSSVVSLGVAESVYTGAVFLAGDRQGFSIDSIGSIIPGQDDTSMPANAIFDLASMSKVISTWCCVGWSLRTAQLRLDTTVESVYPEAAELPIGRATVAQLLTHTAGLLPRANLSQYGVRRRDIELGVMTAELQEAPGTSVRYTDRAPLMLGFLIERVVGRSLASISGEIFRPLGCPGIFYGPVHQNDLHRTVPGGYDDTSGTRWHGVVHDMSTRNLGGVSGIAGCFGTATDIAHFLSAVMAVHNGASAVPSLSRAFVTESMSCRTGGMSPPRGYVWAVDGTIAFHYGFTGTAMWLDPASQRYGALLTNRLLTGRERKPMDAIREEFAKLLSMT